MPKPDKKARDDFLTLTQMDTGVHFYHQNDERNFFEWLDRIPCIDRYVGEGRRGLVVYLKRAPRKDELRELLALCHRYGVNMRQLAKFETARNRHWSVCRPNIGTRPYSDQTMQLTAEFNTATKLLQLGAPSVYLLK
jgi:hypothetical protein